MAAKKKNTRAKKNTPPAEPSYFWRQAWAFILILMALFVLLGAFNLGGSLPSGLFSVGRWLFGLAAFLLPIALIYYAVVKFTNEEHRIPPAQFMGMLLLLSFVAGLMHIFQDQAVAKSVAEDGDGGGMAGFFISSFTLTFLNQFTGVILLLVLILIAFLFSFGITPKQFVKALLPGKKGEGEETGAAHSLSELKSRAGESNFQLNEGVPVERSKEKIKAPVEEATALTAASDPNWKFPGLDLLNNKQDKADPGNIEQNADAIHETMSEFNFDVKMEGANVGPRVTQYTLKPPSGVKLSKIAALNDELAAKLGAHDVRIEAPIPGKSLVGVEVPNRKAATVRIANVMQAAEWGSAKGRLSFAIGRDISGQAVVGELDRMPHLLIAGQTGSGKSVMINTVLVSMLYRNTPSDLKLILIDPKQVELTPYNDIPHLLCPVITQPEKCISALKWAVAEMERRLTAFAEVGKRNIVEYNTAHKDESMPYIVIVIDELADLMMMAARDVEALVVRIAQKARAAGIHLVLATQRPSVDVITGLIKANVPARIAFTVVSQVDSRTIIDVGGADKLLGQGDMLLKTAEMMRLKRIQGAFIDEKEVSAVANFIRQQRPPEYNEEITSQPVQIGKGSVIMDIDETNDPIYQEAVRVVIDAGKASGSFLMRRLRIGYSKSARYMEMMEEQGIVGPSDGTSRPRDVLVNSVEEAFGGSNDEAS